ncbi:efflux RND transporter periplasmic adaptor subunit [Thiohalophilus thiocyanatoxydans]|uniref:RND family efflux transporter MFP subunit n=1 Tax=Thiohalophilus thiocyanatoxydans TaxID=381308 RepID=A0A4R8IUX6_9GAMM|nr:efflux RND transporter periplasmic adaptor subunit [Thiohalophilus thiocyanatoxydans]TDY01537.1 RND family efflux transporter MFP subunit [Thiohalophilus thiocyanatoxydans]
MRAALHTTVLFWGMAVTGWASAAELESATASLQTRPVERVLDGRIEAVHEATVSAQTSGRVVEIHYDVDDYVEKDALLLRFRDNDQRARYNAAKANYDEARAEFERVKDIYERQLVAKSQLDKAEARLKSTRAAFEQASEELENTRVRAPYSGIVVKRHVEVGELASVGQPLFTGISLEVLRASVDIPQEMVRVVRERQQARVFLDRNGKSSVEAESLRISPYADAQSHTFNVRVLLPEGEYGIYPGMFVKVGFVKEEIRRLLIPVKAVVHRSEVTGAYVIDEQGALHLRQLRIGERFDDGMVEVLAGLEEGEQVALDPVRATTHYKEQQAGERQ